MATALAPVGTREAQTATTVVVVAAAAAAAMVATVEVITAMPIAATTVPLLVEAAAFGAASGSVDSPGTSLVDAVVTEVTDTARDMDTADTVEAECLEEEEATAVAACALGAAAAVDSQHPELGADSQALEDVKQFMPWYTLCRFFKNSSLL